MDSNRLRVLEIYQSLAASASLKASGMFHVEHSDDSLPNHPARRPIRISRDSLRGMGIGSRHSIGWLVASACGLASRVVQRQILPPGFRHLNAKGMISPGSATARAVTRF